MNRIPKKIAKSALSNFAKVDKFDIDIEDYHQLIQACRFYYKKDPLIAAVINRLSDMSATDIIIEKGTLRKNEWKALNAVIPMLKEFVRNAVREVLISGLVYPEVDFKRYNKQELRLLGIKNYNSMVLPDKIWLRNPDLIEIKPGLNSSDARYYIKLPDTFIAFINNEGKYDDGTEDKELYERILKEYPDIVEKVKKGEYSINITPKYGVIRKEIHPNSYYPVPYLTPVIEHAAFKRNLRRMDYALASRVITAIMLVKIGSDKFPLTEEDEDAFDNIEMQLRAQSVSGSTSTVEFERVIQLFADHTLNIEWVYPPTDALLDDKKYDPINQEILYGMGFPPSAIIGESLRSNTKSDLAATQIPKIILDPIRNELLLTINKIIYDIINMNRFRGEPGNIRFEPITFESTKDLIELLRFLYDTGGLSRESVVSKFGFDLRNELERRRDEDKLMAKYELTAFPPTPHSNEPPLMGAMETVTDEEE